MKHLLTILLLFSCLLLYAQQEQYFIFLLKGEVQVKKTGQSYAKAKIKQFLSLNDSIQLKNDQSGIIIANTKGDRTEIKGPGIVQLTEIQKKKGPGSTSKFFSYLYEEYLQPKKSGGFSKQSVASSWGAGSRGSYDQLKWPLNNIISSKDSIVFQWRHSSRALNYNFILYDNRENEIISCNVRDTQIVINTINLRAGNKTGYFWSVNTLSQPGPVAAKYFFQLINQEEEERMTSAFIKQLPINDNEILYHLEIADILGQNGLIDKALEYFEKARKEMQNKR